MKIDKEYEFVDLGLPSGLLWATCNLGAEKPWEYGDFFAWGETKSQQKGFFKETYKWKDGYDKWPHRLSMKYDAAHQIMKGDWTMPWKRDFIELIIFTTHEWITDYQGTGVNGHLFTGKNGNELFFPACGFMTEGELYYRNQVSTYLSNWSDKDVDGQRCMWAMDICNAVHFPCVNPRARLWQGFSIRGVLEPAFTHICIAPWYKQNHGKFTLCVLSNREFCKEKAEEILCVTNEEWIQFEIYCMQNDIEPLALSPEAFQTLWGSFPLQRLSY